MITLRLTGNTFEVKDELKADGFKWNMKNKFWYKDFEDADKERAESLATAFEANGVYGEVVAKADPNERKYYVKESWLFNLESMHDKIWCLVYDVRDNKILLPFEVAGKTINGEGDLFDLMNEVDDLTGMARRKVTGKEYGRIREVVGWRVNARYAACMASGMDEAKAGQCFEDI